MQSIFIVLEILHAFPYSSFHTVSPWQPVIALLSP